MIVKVQVANGGGNLLIVNEKQTVRQEITLTADLMKRLGGNQQMYFDATLKKGIVTLNHPVKNQGW